MMKCGKCGGGSIKKEVIPSYEADILGAPFRVTLDNSVHAEICESCGSTVSTVIPNLEGLIQAVAQIRAVKPRKLSGAEIKFLRTAVGCKAKDVAEKLDIAPEHLSRCENDNKMLSNLAEKWFRLFIVVKATDFLQNKPVDFRLMKKQGNIDELLDLKIESTWDTDDIFDLRLVLRKTDLEQHVSDENSEWGPEEVRAA